MVKRYSVASSHVEDELYTKFKAKATLEKKTINQKIKEFMESEVNEPRKPSDRDKIVGNQTVSNRPIQQLEQRTIKIIDDTGTRA